jgi:hypothetical protein
MRVDWYSLAALVTILLVFAAFFVAGWLLG